MELANVQVALGNDKDNTVRKYGVTPAEVAVLQRIHGIDAVFDIEPLKDPYSYKSDSVTAASPDNSQREERNRLIEIYSRVEAGKIVSVVNELYPNHITIEEQFAELALPPNAYMAVERFKPAPIAKKEPGRPGRPKAEPKADTALFEDADKDMPRAGNALV